MQTKGIDWGKYKAVIFDFDGTLYDGKGFSRRLVFADLINALKSRKERQVRKSLAGKDLENAQKFYDAFFGELGEEKREWYFNRYLPTMVKVLERHFKAREGAQELIERLEKEGKAVGILSDYPMVEKRVEAIGLRMKREMMWSSETKGALKPAARPFMEIAERLGVETKEMLVIGDRADTDGMGAKAAGCDCVIVKTEKNEGKTEGYVAMEWREIVE